MKKKEIIIVGGGPAGAFTSLFLTKFFPTLAEDIVLLEAKPLVRDKLCAGGVSGRVLLGAEKELNLDLKSLPHVVTQGILVRYLNREALAKHHDLSRIIRRRFLDAYLLEQAKDRGVEVLTETPVVDVNKNSSRVVVTTASGEQYSGKILVCADGVNGITEKALNLPFKGHKEYLYYVDIPDVENPPYLELDFSPIAYGVPGYIWYFPTKDFEGNGAWTNTGITGGSPDNMAYLKKLCLENFRVRYGKDFDLSTLKFQPYAEKTLAFSNRFNLDRVLFVGDKLGCTPINREGIGVAYSSAKASAQEIIQALGSSDYSFKQYRKRLLMSDITPNWAVERFFSSWRTPKLFPWFVMLFGGEAVQKRGVLAEYCSAFAGECSPWELLTDIRRVKNMAVPSKELFKIQMKDTFNRRD